MAIGDGITWDETNPTDATVANTIDDYNRDVRVGIRSRMALEHEFPASQSSTAQAGQHKFITLQAQSTKPSLSGTQVAAVYVKTNALYFEKSDGTETILLDDSAGATTPTANQLLKLDASAAFPAGTGLLLKNIAFASGTAAHGATLSLISGYSSNQCHFFVSPYRIPNYGHWGMDSLTVALDPSTLVVSVFGTAAADGYVSYGTAQYICIGVK